MSERPMRADARRNYERLLTAAGEAFAERGERASMDEIAKRAGVGAGTLYRHFPTREALVVAVYEAGLSAACGQAHALLARSGPGQALYAWVRVLARHWEECGELSRLMAAIFEQDGAAKESCQRMLFDAADAVLAEARAAGTVRADLSAVELIRLTHTAVLAAAPRRTAEVVPVDRMLELTLDGVRPRG
ncbi:TetR/AcrR family transcriptional regulator [Kitasatospora sp. NPDC058965]|uniref:TetR/AcrR family transcriptional regulator n=1 Tax=Kitasatospora sp. NPDC058965 TaxID=3346682 RepID=UPI0036C9619F